MDERKRLLALIAIMAVAVFLSGAIAIGLLYQAAVEQQRTRLIETAQSRARLMEAVARFDRVYSRDYPGGARAATISQIADAHERFGGFGETGEFTLAERAGDDIVFVLRHRHAQVMTPAPVPFSSELAEPMRRALSGKSGTVVGLDYHGVTVLAAHEPVAVLDLGIVAKIDLAEIRAPFVKAGSIAAGAAVALVLIGTALFWRISSPLIRSLEERVRERTVELEAANTEMESFAYSVSHDLRAPLRAIDGFSRIVLESHAGSLDDEAKHGLERVRAGVHNMSRLIDDLLKLSRATRGELKRETLDMSGMARAIAAQLTDAEPERRVAFDIGPGVTGYGGSVFVRVVLENLLGNAWKFTAGEEHAEIRFGVVRQKGVPVYFVSDNGIGFDMAFADRLFTPFQRLHGADEFEGSGIGLATVERIVRRHGGTVSAETMVGKGATFYFTLSPHIHIVTPH
jgi:signal transduction histidine kinase